MRAAAEFGSPRARFSRRGGLWIGLGCAGMDDTSVPPCGPYGPSGKRKTAPYGDFVPPLRILPIQGLASPHTLRGRQAQGIRMKILNIVTLLLIIIGAVNWGLVGLF